MGTGHGHRVCQLQGGLARLTPVKQPVKQLCQHVFDDIRTEGGRAQDIRTEGIRTQNMRTEGIRTKVIRTDCQQHTGRS
eukprot:969686-Pelagomonas_calceolata.AAC.3